MVKQLEKQSDSLLRDDDPVEKTRSLISALNYVSRDLLLPPHLYDSVSSIYHASLSDASPMPPPVSCSFPFLSLPLRIRVFFVIRYAGCRSNLLVL